ncbi:LLM class flavin-dependent oxidoreductase [Kitasatospora sp. NPDC058965]|uniref:LLM class flavin-dependent oxidoreductase n=1 Tax=Kitasatospora sp. NPDC058965 TaxID=3346682 RepID=UPI0036A34316
MADLTFGIKTTPMHVEYADVLAVWQQADRFPQIADAWLWDHLLPMGPDKAGPCLEGWTLLSALAGQTDRLGLGLLVTSNRLRAPALLGKMASTVDVISGGRLVLGLGVGGTHQRGPNPAAEEYAAYGFDLVPPREGLARLDETVRILRRMWTEERFDFDGPFTTLRGTRNAPKPVRPGGPPVLIGGWGDRTLKLVAEHADIWNVPGPPHNPVSFLAERAAVLDAHCAALGRDPGEIRRSVQLVVNYRDPAESRRLATELVAAGADHLVLALPAGYPDGVVEWAVEQIVEPVAARFR